MKNLKNNKSFVNGELIITLLRRKNLTQRRVARRLRLHPATFNQLLSGQHRASDVTILSLAHILGTSPQALIDKGVNFYQLLDEALTK